MTEKEKNQQIARRLLSAAFWRAEYFPEFFSEDFTMDFPSAPPGMLNHFDVWESERCFEWLKRTVKSWSVELEEFYSTPDAGQFWAIGICRGEVHWGDQDNHFQSKFFARMELHNGRANYIKGWMDTLAFLRAAGLAIPEIIKDIYNPRINDFLTNMPKRFRKEKVPGTVDMSEEAIAKRLADNLKQNVCGVEREKYRKAETMNPFYKRGAWFIPDRQPYTTTVSDFDRSIMSNGDVEAQAPEKIRPNIFAWVKLSSPWMYRDTRGINFPTDDPLAFFAEMHSNGPACWLGNGCEHGHYHQEYLMVLKFDEAGRELIRDEVICPMNKYNSTNISLPSFPYYL